MQEAGPSLTWSPSLIHRGYQVDLSGCELEGEMVSGSYWFVE